MSLSPQSIRSGVKIYIEKKQASKDEVLLVSEGWNERQENFFKKMLQQGGEFTLKGLNFKIIPKFQILNSKGEKDGGIQKMGDIRF